MLAFPDLDPAVRARAEKIRLLVFDVDGVLTSGALFLGDDGQEYKSFHSRDGHGMKMLHRNGVELAIITGRTSRVVALRMESLGIEHVYQGQLDKLPAYDALMERLDLTSEQVAYMGDDVVDLPIMRRVGLSIAVADAHPLVLENAHWHTARCGGQGAAREACEMLMQAQGTLEAEMQSYL